MAGQGTACTRDFDAGVAREVKFSEVAKLEGLGEHLGELVLGERQRRQRVQLGEVSGQPGQLVRRQTEGLLMDPNKKWNGSASGMGYILLVLLFQSLRVPPV